MNFKTLALATVAAVGLCGAASAASLSLAGGDGVAIFGTTANYKLGPVGCITTCYNPSGPAAGLTNNLTTYTSTYPGLNISGLANVRFTFLGSEAAATNRVLSIGGNELNDKTSPVGSFFDVVLGPNAGGLNFKFTSTFAGGTQAGFGGITGGAGIAFSQLFDGGRYVYAYFDDSGGDIDRDWDDMVVKIEVVPVPAAGLLLLGGLGALAAVKRRRKAA